MPNEHKQPTGGYQSEDELRASIKAHTAGRPEGEPNYTMRRLMLAAGAGTAAVLAFFSGRAIINAHNQDSLNAELSQPFPDVAAEIREGKIDPSQVTKFKVGDTEYAWSVASHLTQEDHQGDTGTVSDIVAAQQGNPTEAGSTVIVPNGEVDHPDPMQK